MTKIIIALLPAIGAHLAVYRMDKHTLDQDIWFVVIAACLILGGILSAIFITRAIHRDNVERNTLLVSAIGVVTFIVYVALFSITMVVLAMLEWE